MPKGARRATLRNVSLRGRNKPCFVLSELKRAAGTAELGSCLTDATPRAVPDMPSRICRYVRPERIALAIFAALLTRWYHAQTSVSDFPN
jgi:hypothetical protein